MARKTAAVTKADTKRSVPEAASSSAKRVKKGSKKEEELAKAKAAAAAAAAQESSSSEESSSEESSSEEEASSSSDSESSSASSSSAESSDNEAPATNGAAAESDSDSSDSESESDSSDSESSSGSSSGSDDSDSDSGSESDEAPAMKMKSAAKSAGLNGDANGASSNIRVLVAFDKPTSESEIKKMFGGALSVSTPASAAVLEYAAFQDARNAVQGVGEGVTCSIVPAPRAAFTPRSGGGEDGAEVESNTIFCGNLPFTVTDDDLRDFFSAAGDVTAARIAYDRETERPRGFGYVEFADMAAAKAAIEQMNGQELQGRAVRLDLSQPRTPGGGRGGFGGGRGGGFGGGRGGGFGGGRGGGFGGGRGGGFGGGRGGGFGGGRGRGGDRGRGGRGGGFGGGFRGQKISFD